MDDKEQAWRRGRGWGAHQDDPYAKVLYQRAVGELPEMESSKAAAARLEGWLMAGDSLLDVGCGAGHYLLSLRRRLGGGFRYTGLDATPLYIEMARKAFPDDPDAGFTVGDAYHLPWPDMSFDLAMCCNLMLHLPSLARPLAELCRVAKRGVLLRTLVGERSFRIQEVRGAGDEFDDQGEPRAFNYYNIYSRAYVDHLLASLPRVAGWEISPDRSFDARLIEQAAQDQGGAMNATRMLGGWQVNGYILQPWAFVRITLSD